MSPPHVDKPGNTLVRDIVAGLYESTDGGVAARVSVFGLGHVGTVSAVCLAARGHRVVGVDVNAEKVAAIRSGSAPITEGMIDVLTASVVDNGKLVATGDARSAVAQSDVSLICVGSRAGSEGRAALDEVTAQIGSALAVKTGWHVVAFRTTMAPGTCENHMIPRLESASGKRAGVDFGVCVNPEFLRRGTSVRDFMEPSRIVVGQSDSRSGDAVAQLYHDLPGTRSRVSLTVAEVTKYVDNSFRALTAGFANEIRAFCAALDLDSDQVVESVLAGVEPDFTALLRPGHARAPKEVRALTDTPPQRRRHTAVVESAEGQRGTAASGDRHGDHLRATRRRRSRTVK